MGSRPFNLKDSGAPQFRLTQTSHLQKVVSEFLREEVCDEHDRLEKHKMPLLPGTRSELVAMVTVSRRWFLLVVR